MPQSQILGYVTPVRAFSTPTGIYMQAASGRVADALAKHYDKVFLCARVVYDEPPFPGDLQMEAANIELIAQPFWRTSAGSLPHAFGIARSYWRTCRRSDVIFVRGMCPYILILYLCAFLFRRPICQWIVGDPVALLRTSGRNGFVLDMLGLLYALQDRVSSRVGRWLAGGAFVCNGRELARAYRSPRTLEVVSSTVKDSEFFVRCDTCQQPTIRILFVGYIRPEKGIEYLLEAVSLLRMDKSWELEIVGPDQFPGYRKRLDAIVESCGIADRVYWSGYMPYGQPLLNRMRLADILVLPSLSEGTPHVLVEARANSLPCISTTVGGVPTTVRHEYDALLVPPKNSIALARAIERMAYEGNFRRALIRRGLISARQQTLSRFISLVHAELKSRFPARETAVIQE